MMSGNDDLGQMFDEAFSEAGSEAGGDSGSEAPEVVETDTQVDEPVVESTDVEDDSDVETDNGEPEVADEPIGDETWNWEDFSDRLVPRKVDGQVEMVTLKEAIEGSMRQADYTRKTQELAETERAAKWAGDIQAALASDPVGTLQAIAEAYGLVDLTNSQDTSQGNQLSLEDLDEDVRPWAQQAMEANRRLVEMERRLQAQETSRLEQEVRREVESLKQRYQDFDPMQTLRVAAQKNWPLEDAYWYLKGQAVQQQTQTQQQTDAAAAEAAAQAKADAEAQRQQQKKSAAGSATKSFKASDIPADDFDDIGELFERIAANS